jgi:hypothetical protein
MFLPYDPGALPFAPPPRQGESIRLEIVGWPPWKDVHYSIRNPKHEDHARFVALRRAAVSAMAGRARSQGPIGLRLELHAPELEARRTVLDYLSGVMDTLDGSQGPAFTYLPIAYEDDCQVSESSGTFVAGAEPRYFLEIRFLADG